jgi:hydroxymethylbilane synthase
VSSPSVSAARPAARLATRRSPLARWQAERVRTLLAERTGLAPSLVAVETTGDRRADVPLDRIGGQGVFVKEVQAAVLEGRADLAVHSAKDLPAARPPGLTLAAVPERADRRDALVGSTLEGLRTGATIATGSVRRRAQLAWLRPDLTFVDLRGNMATRLERSLAVGAGVVAAAALDRLGLVDHIAEILELGTMVPQVAQGALAVECRSDDNRMLELLSVIDDPVAHTEVRAERAFLAGLGAGCTLPLGAWAICVDGSVELTGLVASRDGAVVLRHRHIGTDPEAVGTALAEWLLDHGGARALGDWLP